MIPRELLAALRQIEIHTSRLATNALAGNYQSVFRGQGIVFREVRPYQIGDDVRFIDWNVSARMGEPFVKLFTEEREMTVMLLVDASASTRFGTRRASKARLAAEVSALLAFSAIKGGDRVGLVTVSDRIETLVPPRKGEKHVLRVAREVLAGEPTGRGTDLALGLETLGRLSKRRSVAFVVSDFHVEGQARRAAFEKALALNSQKHDLIAVELRDPRDGQLPDLGLLTVEDLETGEDVVVDTSDPAVRKALAKATAEQQRSLRTTLGKLGIDHVVVHTDGSYVNPIRELFARRARRRRA